MVNRVRWISWLLVLVALEHRALGEPVERDKRGPAEDTQGAAATEDSAAKAPDAAPSVAAETAATDTSDAESSKSAEKSATSGEPRLHHGPISVTPAHQELLIEADIDHPELVRRALLVYFVRHRPGAKEVEFRRGNRGYVAAIPAEDVRWPGVAYAIEIERLDGRRSEAFASRVRPHQVLVPEDLMDVRERALSERLQGRRSVFFASGEYVDFGGGVAQVTLFDGSTRVIPVSDSYYRVEGGFSYRFLRLVTEFSLRIGVVRGESPVAVNRRLEPDEPPENLVKVGLNYGAPSVRLRLHDWFHLEGEFLTSVTEVGFSVGAGGAALIGDPYGSKLVIGFESVQDFGDRFFSRLEAVAAPGVTLAPMIEATNMPHADSYGVRLLGEVGVDIGYGFGVALRGGYQARVFKNGGPSFGATLSYAF